MQAYELIGRAGAGANSTVYRAKFPDTGVTVAIKKLDGHHTPVAQVVQEAAVMRACAHKHTVELLAAYQAEGTGSVYLIMEHVEHNLSRELLLNPRGLPLPRAKLIIYQLAQALELMHAKQWTHADIKPANILLTGGALSNVKLCDFGSATSPLLTTVTASDDLNGAACTPPPPATTAAASRWYCAPESLLGGNATPASDIWAVGCLLAELLTGKPVMPGSEEELDQVCWVIATIGHLAPSQEALLQLLPPEQRARVEAARARGPLLDKMPKVASCPALGAVLRACLNPDPAARPTAAQLQAHPFFDDLRAALAAAANAAAASKPASCDGSGSDGDGSSARRRSSADGCTATAMDIDTPPSAAAASGASGSASTSPDEAAAAAAAGRTLASADGAPTAVAPPRAPRRVGGVQAAVQPAPRPRVSALTATIRGRGPFEGDGSYIDLMPAVLRLAARWEMAVADEGKGPIALAACHSAALPAPLTTACSGELPLAPQAIGTSFGGCSAAGTSVGGASAAGAWAGFGSVGASGGGGGCTSAGVIAAAAAAVGSMPGASGCMTPIAAAAGGCGAAPPGGTGVAGTSAGGAASTAPSPMQCTPAAMPASAASPPPLASIAAAAATTLAPSTTDPTLGIPIAAAVPVSADAAGEATGAKASIPISSSVGHVPYLARVSRLAASSSGAAAAGSGTRAGSGAYDSPLSKGAGGGAAAAAAAGSLPSFGLSPAQLRSRAIVNRARRHAAGSGHQHQNSNTSGNHFHHQHQLHGEFAAAARAGSPRAGRSGGGAGLGASATLLQQELHGAQQPHHHFRGHAGAPPAARPHGAAGGAAATGLGARHAGHATRRSFADLSELASVSEMAPLACGNDAKQDTKRLRRIAANGGGDEAGGGGGGGGSLGAGSLLSGELGLLSSLPEHAQFLGSADTTTLGAGVGSGSAPRRRMRRSSSGTGMAAQQFAFGAAGVVVAGGAGTAAVQQPWRPEATGRSQPIAMKPRVGGGGGGGFHVLMDSPSTELNNNSGASEAYLQEDVA
ncbi:hypothetical protein CHLRE_16g687400v5 [Chlamydomonas reinhardtii]|uniref:Protein kinase domain-containing protein n=1 Tax=Chlamydomonas reinhardtii TaxID=3055 RepID=A0A2K3CUL9_CHLRE|nr:uncharacterized protein CHLRE_16g687400v5 [Chlamydomonas reinhardtii]PNW71981.1 hypothetical protein CHLRE_16g687400v5 [Chlamydomonas reinhardtii]